MAGRQANQQEQLVEDLERLHFKLRMEAAIVLDPDVAKRLNDIAVEAEDTLNRIVADNTPT